MTPAQAPDWRGILLCAGLYLLVSLQQVSLDPLRLGPFGMSLGSLVLRLCLLGTAGWLLWRHGLPAVLRTALPGFVACLAVLAASALLSGQRSVALAFAVRYGTELLALWTLLHLALTFPGFPRVAILALLGVLWGNLLLSAGILLELAPLHTLALLFHPPQTFGYLPRVSGIHEHPSLLAATGVMVALLVTHLHDSGQAGKRSLLCAWSGAAAALLLSGSRNPLLPVLLLGAGALWHRHQAGATGAYPLGRLLLPGSLLLMGAMLFSRYGDISSAVSENLLTRFTLGRTYLWEGAFQAWLSRPGFGLGPGVFQFLTPDFTGGRFDRGELHAHNLPLAILSETGLAGLLAFLGLLAGLWRPLLGSSDERLRRWSWGWLLLLASFGIFDFYLPFHAFALHAALAPSALYADLQGRSAACSTSRIRR